MGWRETLGAAVPESAPLPRTTRNTQNPGRAQEPSPEPVGFGGSGGIGYGGGNLKSPAAVPAGTGLLEALAAARDGLPLSVEELAEAFGEEGAADWAEGYTPHCRPEFLRAFAVAVSERLAREREAANEPGPPAPKAEPPPPPPGPLDGLPLLRGDWALIDKRARGRHREALLLEYARRWREAADAEPVGFRKANTGRRAANAWLREVRQ